MLSLVVSFTRKATVDIDSSSVTMYALLYFASIVLYMKIASASNLSCPDAPLYSIDFANMMIVII